MKIFTVTLPDIGEGVVEGEVIEWLKQPGESLAQDEPVVIVMTDKATVELPAPYVGTLAKHYYKVGEIAKKDQPLYDIQLDPTVESPATPTHVLSTPPVRKLAKEMGIDIEQISGTGKEGIVTEEDLKQASAPSAEEKPLVGIRKMMAMRMVQSHTEIPQFSYFAQLDATRLIQLRHNFLKDASAEGISISYMPFVIRALSLTLSQFAILNSSFNKSSYAVQYHKNHNIGIATSTKQGLIVPVLKNVEKMNLKEVILKYDDLKKRALSHELAPAEMKEGTITISNFGVLGEDGLWATPIINYPEAAILGIAKIHKQPVVHNSAIEIRDMMNLSWSFDHRIIDGAQAVDISHFFCNLLQNPAALL